jgi:multiple sugar transport system ATP-binding protein
VLYERPANLFVAEFIGSPAMNLVEARLERRNGELCAGFGEASLRVPEAVVAARPALAGYAGRTVALGIRPEDLEDSAVAGGNSAARFVANVDIREDMGSEVYLHCSVAATPVRTSDVKAALEPEAVEALAAEVAGTPFVARVDRASAVREGDRLEFVVDTHRLQFFDLDDGAGIYGDGAVASAPPTSAVHEA